MKTDTVRRLKKTKEAVWQGQMWKEPSEHICCYFSSCARRIPKYKSDSSPEDILEASEKQQSSSAKRLTRRPTWLHHRFLPFWLAFATSFKAYTTVHVYKPQKHCITEKWASFARQEVISVARFQRKVNVRWAGLKNNISPQGHPNSKADKPEVFRRGSFCAFLLKALPVFCASHGAPQQKLTQREQKSLKKQAAAGGALVICNM